MSGPIATFIKNKNRSNASNWMQVGMHPITGIASTIYLFLSGPK
jgi:hypothetical protein